MKAKAALFLALVSSQAIAAPYFNEDFENATASKDLVDSQFQQFSISSNSDWIVSVYDNDTYASANGYGADTASEDWLVSNSIDLSGATSPALRFESAKQYDGGDFEIFVSTNFTGDVTTATWQEVIPNALSTGSYSWVDSGSMDLSAYAGNQVVVAFKYTSTGTGSGDGAIWQVDDVVVDEASFNVTLTSPKTAFLNNPFNLNVNIENTAASSLTYNLSINGSTPQAWEPTDAITLTQVGENEIVVSVNDGSDTKEDSVTIYAVESTEQAVLTKPDDALRVASYNINLIGESETQADLISVLEGGNYVKAKQLAEVIQRVRPDIILLNEFDYDDAERALQLFKEQYLQVAQQTDVLPIMYSYHFSNEVNTGVPSGMDFNNNGSTTDPDDAFGFGQYPGKYGMAVLSMYPIEETAVRTFQKFLWKDMPNAKLPATAADGNWYSDEELAIFRLSSKSHWDLPIEINGQTLHILASHPTPPVFDGEEDRNGTRNHDEIRFWADYIDSNKAGYIYDDASETGGLADDTSFVIMGDQNASTVEGDGTDNPMQLLLGNSLVQDPMPFSQGGIENTPESEFSANHTASWAMRADYVLPSTYGLEVVQSAVFWPTSDNALSSLASANTPTDHRLVYVDMKVAAALETENQSDSTEVTSSSSSGGCSLSRNPSVFDPTLWLLVLFSMGYLFINRRKKNKTI